MVSSRNGERAGDAKVPGRGARGDVRGTELWSLAAARVEAALAVGALAPLESARFEVEDAGVRFVVRLLAERREKPRSPGGPRPVAANPFLPYDESLFVADLGSRHVCLLNKFPVVSPHLLIVTRAFEDQQTLLTAADFEALLGSMDGVPTLGFYNGGPRAGASQPHKHLQVVRLPLGLGPEATPLGAALAAGVQLPFAFAQEPLPGDGSLAKRAGAAHDRYLALRERCALRDPAAPYNLLLSADRMTLIPRREECWRGISVNALGFAGSLLAANAAELSALRAAGPMEALRQTGMPPGS